MPSSGFAKKTRVPSFGFAKKTKLSGGFFDEGITFFQRHSEILYFVFSADNFSMVLSFSKMVVFFFVLVYNDDFLL